MPDYGQIAVVEDDAEIRDLVAALLRREGFSVAAFADGAALDAFLAEETPQAVILDVMLPGEDGLAICRRLRAAGDLPILMVTAKGDPIDRIIGLEIGADDYLPKPFEPRELIARLRALLRRAAPARSAAPPGPSAEKQADRFRLDDLRVDLAARTVERDGVDLALTAAEFDLLVALMEAPGRAHSRDHLLDRVFGRSAAPYDRAIDVLVSRLRRKIEPDPGRPSLVKTVRSAGYLLTARRVADGE